MAERKRKYALLYVIFAMMGTVAILASPVKDPFGRVTYAVPDKAGFVVDDALYVDTSSIVSSPDQLQAFPPTIGEWNMTTQWDWSNIARTLNTDMLLARDYRDANLSQAPVSIVIIQSDNITSFHPAEVCYQVQGYSFLEGSGQTIDIPLTKDSKIRARELLVEKTLKNGQTQRVLNLHYYLRREAHGVEDRITWVRVSTYLRSETDAPAQSQRLVSFLRGSAGPLLSPSNGPGRETVAQWLVQRLA